MQCSTCNAELDSDNAFCVACEHAGQRTGAGYRCGPDLSAAAAGLAAPRPPAPLGLSSVLTGACPGRPALEEQRHGRVSAPHRHWR